MPTPRSVGLVTTADAGGEEPLGEHTLGRGIIVPAVGLTRAGKSPVASPVPASALEVWDRCSEVTVLHNTRCSGACLTKGA